MSAGAQRLPEAAAAFAKIDNKPEIFSFFAEKNRVFPMLSWLIYYTLSLVFFYFFSFS